jgi:hypothetical protein
VSWHVHLADRTTCNAGKAIHGCDVCREPFDEFMTF